MGQIHAPGGLKKLDDFVSGWLTPSDGYTTPPEDFEEDQLSHEELLSHLTISKEESLGSKKLTKDNFERIPSYESAGDEDKEGEVKLKWMWTDTGVSSWLDQVCHNTKYTCHCPN